MGISVFSYGRMVKKDGAVQPEYHVNDYLCSVRVVTDADGEVLERNDYSGFGKRLASSAGSANRYRFSGKEEQGFAGVPWQDFGARMYDPDLARWTTPDPLAEKYPGISPYVYCNDNPVNYVDYDGKDWFDAFVGYLVGTATNLIPGTESLRDSYSPTDPTDYNSALRISDNIAAAAGSTLMIAGEGGMAGGATMMAAGTTMTVSSGGALVIAGGPVAIAGAEVLAIGAISTATGAMLMANSEENKSGGYERGNISTGNKNSKHANLKAKQTAAQKYEDAKAKYNELKNKPNKTPEEVKQREKYRQQYEHWKRKMDFSGENHSRNAKGNR